MRTMTKRVPLVALFALLLVFAACKGESPTAPPPGGGIPPGQTPPPASGVDIVLSVSSTDPLVDSTVVITARVTQDGNPVPNGTAVEFSASNNGRFNDTASSTTIRTTTDGVATASLTSSTAGAVRVTAVVNNIVRTTDVTFRARPVTQPPPNTSPTITSITPSVGRPSGGETIRIVGTNLRGPVRVLFDVGGPVPVEGFVVSRTDTTIEVITPSVNLGAGQQLVSRIIVLTQAGSPNEQRVEVTEGFTFRNELLDPRISTATPNSGPVLGGTRVSIIGDGFQAPVQVLFGSAEARVIEVRFNEIIVEAPAGRDTSPDGSGPVVGPVDITVVNIASATRTTLAGGFRYVANMQITAAGPTQGGIEGGTRVTIEGNGFVAPVAVTIGGVAATPVFVSGTRIIALTSAPILAGCTNITGPIVVTNISNGDSATGPDFTFVIPRPAILNVSGDVVPGGAVNITVLNAGTLPRLQAGSATLPITGATTVDGVTTFSATLPNDIQLATQACPGGTGTRSIPTTVQLTFTDLASTCTSTFGVTVQPPDQPVLFVSPTALTITAVAPNPTATPPTAGTPGSGVVTVVNTGTQPLTINNATASPNPPFSSSNPAGTVLTTCQSFNIIVGYQQQPAGTQTAGQLQIQTTAGTATVSLLGRSQ